LGVRRDTGLVLTLVYRAAQVAARRSLPPVSRPAATLLTIARPSGYGYSASRISAFPLPGP
jgi:hypothetical protein